MDEGIRFDVDIFRGYGCVFAVVTKQEVKREAALCSIDERERMSMGRWPGSAHRLCGQDSGGVGGGVSGGSRRHARSYSSRRFGNLTRLCDTSGMAYISDRN